MVGQSWPRQLTPPAPKLRRNRIHAFAPAAASTRRTGSWNSPGLREAGSTVASVGSKARRRRLTSTSIARRPSMLTAPRTRTVICWRRFAAGRDSLASFSSDSLSLPTLTVAPGLRLRSRRRPHLPQDRRPIRNGSRRARLRALGRRRSTRLARRPDIGYGPARVPARVAVSLTRGSVVAGMAGWTTICARSC